MKKKKRFVNKAFPIINSENGHFHCRSRITVTAARHFYDFVVVIVVVYAVAVSDACFFFFSVRSTNRINESNWNMALLSMNAMFN